MKRPEKQSTERVEIQEQPGMEERFQPHWGWGEPSNETLP
jgi:hypothetical protein